MLYDLFLQPFQPKGISVSLENSLRVSAQVIGQLTVRCGAALYGTGMESQSPP